jgi:hypothetical protein
MLLVFWLACVTSEMGITELTPEEIRIVREAVYDRKAIVATDDKTLIRFVVVPAPLEQLYKERPEQVFALLQKIMDGARPMDSIIAASYAFELTKGRGRGTIVVEYSVPRTKEYDQVDKDWGKTPRAHWIGKLNSR